jgi:hypothetical protein
MHLGCVSMQKNIVDRNVYPDQFGKIYKKKKTVKRGKIGRIINAEKTRIIGIFYVLLKTRKTESIYGKERLCVRDGDGGNRMKPSTMTEEERGQTAAEKQVADPLGRASIPSRTGD